MGVSLGPGARCLRASPHFTAVKLWKASWTPSAECRTSGPAPGPDRGPVPLRALASGLRGAAGGRRGAHESESAQKDGRAKPGGQTLGTLLGHV